MGSARARRRMPFSHRSRSARLAKGQAAAAKGTGRKMRKYATKGLRAGGSLLVAGALSWAPSATAQTAECIPLIDQSDPDGDGVFFEHITSAGLRDVRVSTTNLGALGPSATAMVRAFGLAAGIWNEQGGGRPIRYR